MDKGYLLILVSAGISALHALGVMNFMLGGYLLVAAGLHALPIAAKELKTARTFTFGALALHLRFFLPQFLLGNLYISSFLSISYLFFSVGIFFWLLKAEYIWSPHRRKRTDLLVYSGVALLYLVVYALFIFPWITIHLLPLHMVMQLVEIHRFINILYHIVLIYILAKLYLEAKRGGPGLRRWA
ncbi:MAG: hypothetical protein FWG67_02420 [Defluviitaleaceae bacterium]|nr:hypothetical protein [Defluviitaleaceae bacterium]